MTYSSGYDDSLIKQFQQRKLAQSAGFFLPHLRADMHLLDCGCGPGSLTAGFAEQVARVTGIDIAPAQVSLAHRNYRRGNLHFAAGNVYHLPFAPATFDAIYSQALLYHLADPVNALHEFQRILKPGGLIGIRDSDFDGTLIYPENPLVKRASDLLARVIETHGGDPYMGRKQRTLLRAAGFKDVRLSASFDIHSVPGEIGAFCDYLTTHLNTPEVVSVLRENALTTLDELKHITDALLVWREHPDALVMLCRCEAVATSPG